MFAFVPMFIVAAAVVVMGQDALAIARDDYQRLLPTFVMTQMPLVMQILFFGALQLHLLREEPLYQKQQKYNQYPSPKFGR